MSGKIANYRKIAFDAIGEFDRMNTPDQLRLRENY